MLKIVRYASYLIFITVVSLEIILRIYNPFEFRQRGNDVVLPRNRKMHFTNNSIPVLEHQIIHTKNSLGFRGPEPPANFDSCLSIFIVGGSATECFFISDKKCWSDILFEKMKAGDPTIWINNAGFQGHSTYGHSILINDYLKGFHPDYIFMMAGYNEIDREDIREDESVSKNSKRNTAWGWLKRNSEVVNMILNIQRYSMADKLSVTDGYVNLSNKNNQPLFLSDRFIDSVVAKQENLIESYSKRLTQIVDTCVANNINLVLITQPILFGVGKDAATGASLETYSFNNGRNGKLMWELLKKYNEVTQKIAKEKNIPLIDLADLLPKSSLYFYDICHFSNEGCAKVADIIFRSLQLNNIVK